METSADHPLGATSWYPTDGDHHQDHFEGGYHYQQQSDHYHGYNYAGDSYDSSQWHINGNSNHALPLSGQKRQMNHPNSVDYGGYAKLYIVGITRTATEQDVAAVFGEFGQILEIIILKDKRTGSQKECCFVKYAALEQADRAIGALNNQYTFPGGVMPMEVRYADGERERLGSLYYHKLYIGGLHKQAFERDIEEIFSPFGVIDDIYLLRDEFKQSRGCSFVQYTRREMAVAAIHALNGTYVMRGCEQPLIVRFADPKKPRMWDSRPPPYMNAPSSGQVPFTDKQNMKPCSQSGTKISKTTCSDAAQAPMPPHAINPSDETDDFTECDWSEHVSPDGDLYYYNRMTCESRWEKPDEYALYEQELDDLEEEPQWQDEPKAQTLCPLQVSE